MRFRPGDSSMEKIEAPDMYYMRALTLSGYDNIWFAGEPYGTGDNIIGNYYRGTWTFYEDPSAYGMDYLHFFSRDNGWGFSDNRIYRFDGQSWYFSLELPAWKSLKPCAYKSPTDIWMIGYPPDGSSGVVLHYYAGNWREVFKPDANMYIGDVAMWNDANGWAVGSEKVGTENYGRTWQCVHGVWHERLCPVEESVRDVEVVSKTEAWALTSDKILHYTTASKVVPASFGRIKAVYAAGTRPDSGRVPPNAAVRVAELPPAARLGPIPADPKATTTTEGQSD
jgi:hypothetical protein